MRYGLVYVLINTENGKLYVGQTVDFHKRMLNHSRSKNECSISRAIRKYGWGSFDSNVVAYAENQQQLDELERIWIAFLDTTNIGRGYNLREGGNSCAFTPEVRARMSDAHIGRSNGYWKGRKRPEMGEQNKRVFTGRIPWNKGKCKPKLPRKPPSGGSFPGELNPFWGKTHTEDSLRIMSLKSSGRVQPEDEKSRRKASLIAHYSTPEAREKQRELAMRRWAK